MGEITRTSAKAPVSTSPQTDATPSTTSTTTRRTTRDSVARDAVDLLDREPVHKRPKRGDIILERPPVLIKPLPFPLPPDDVPPTLLPGELPPTGPGGRRPPIGILPEPPAEATPPHDFSDVPEDLRPAYESYQRWLDSKSGPGPHTLEYREPPEGWGEYQKQQRIEDIENSDYPPEVKEYLRRVEAQKRPDGTQTLLYIQPPAGWEDEFGPKVVPL